MDLANIKVGMKVTASTTKNPMKRKGTVTHIEPGSKGAWITIKEQGSDTGFKTRASLVETA